jgi:hypothetical protein
LLVTEVPVEAVKKTVSAQFGPEGERALMTAAEKLTEEARQQALAQGVALGRAETVLKQLSLRFGPLPDAVVQRIHRASLAELDALTERVLTAKTLDEALG